MEEVWKDIEGYEGIYQVSNYGKIKRTYANGKTKILKQWINAQGTPMLKLAKNGKGREFRVGLLVAKAFIPNPYNKPEISHINNDKTDNRAENIKWDYYKWRKNKTPDLITYKGKTYRSYREMAKDNGINIKTFQKRLKRGWTLLEAIEIPEKRKQKCLQIALYKYKDKLMSVKQLSAINNISARNINRRMHEFGWSVEEAVEIPLSIKKQKGGKNSGK